MDTRHQRTGLQGVATLHVVLAACGLLSLLALLLWSVWANNFSAEGVSCRERGGRMTWSGCVVPQASTARPDARSASAP
jgi:hypothetical protein